jgi:hypothetical protein
MVGSRAGGGAAAFAPTSRLLTKAAARMAEPGGPDPVLVAGRLLANQPQVADRGMMAEPQRWKRPSPEMAGRR